MVGSGPAFMPMMMARRQYRTIHRFMDNCDDDDDTFFIPKTTRSFDLGNVNSPGNSDKGRNHQQVTWDDINLMDKTCDFEPHELGLFCGEQQPPINELVSLHQFKSMEMMPRRQRSTDSDDSASKMSRVSRAGSIVDDLLVSIYDNNCARSYSIDSDTITEYSTTSEYHRKSDCIRYTRSSLLQKGPDDISYILSLLKLNITQVSQVLTRQLKRKDRLKLKRDRNFDIITAALQAVSPKRRVDTRMKFTIEPLSGDSGFNQWLDAMKMVARLSEGVPHEFRKRLWLTLADRHIQHYKIDWARTRSFCFNERSNPDDDNLGVQIVKDLHRTGCSLFCGEDAEHNQALLKRVLLAYARWNKTVGYCQGFNMLAALILEVMDKKEDDALKVMILLIEGVLPESYFADNLRGLSVDMAVFRDLLKLRLQFLSRHLEKLQIEARDGGTGTSYEPPLTNVFTMQWFLTIFSNCLPKSTVLRVWDLIFLEGSEVLLRTGLAIWDGLADRIMTVESADEFYSIMGVLTREMLEFGLMDANHLVKTIVQMAPFPFPQLSELRDKYTYNITPFTSAVGAVRRGLRMFYSDDEYEDDEDVDEQQIAVATWCLTDAFPPPKSPDIPRDSMGRSPSPSSTNFNSIGPGAFGPGSLANLPSPSKHNIDLERMSLDISALKKQYIKLRERQKQARIILTAGARQIPNRIERPPIAVNHLLLGKKALSSRKKKAINPVVCNTASKSKSRPKVLTRQMSMDPKMFRKTTDRNIPTIFWKDVKSSKSPKIVTNDIKISIEAEQFAEINAKRRNLDSSRNSEGEKQAEKKDESCKSNDDNDDNDDSSSTSTELCDDPDQMSDLSLDDDLKVSLTPIKQESVVEESDEFYSSQISENLNKSAPSTPCQRNVSFFGSNEDLTVDSCTYTTNKCQQKCDKPEDKMNSDTISPEAKSKSSDEGIKELKEAVNKLRLTPRRYTNTNTVDNNTISSLNKCDNPTEDILKIEVDNEMFSSYSATLINYSPDSNTAAISPNRISSLSTSTDSQSSSNPVSPTFPTFNGRNRSMSIECSQRSIGPFNMNNQRSRAVSNPTSPVYVQADILPVSLSNNSLVFSGKSSRKISFNNNCLSKSELEMSRTSSSLSNSPSKQAYNPFPTTRLRTKEINNVGLKLGIYSKKIQSHDGFKVLKSK